LRIISFIGEAGTGARARLSSFPVIGHVLALRDMVAAFGRVLGREVRYASAQTRRRRSIALAHREARRCPCAAGEGLCRSPLFQAAIAVVP
jgi:hypothetical protein